MTQIYAANWEDINPKDWAAWPCRYFTPFEVRDRRTGEVKTTSEFLAWMDALRIDYGLPIYVNSWYRSPESNKTVSDTGEDGAHTSGEALDIRVSLANAVRLVEVAMRSGCKRIGLKQHGPHDKRFVHLDFDRSKPSPRFWTYP